MKRMMLVFCGMMIAGCATTGNLEEANAKIADLAKRVAELEKRPRSQPPAQNRRGLLNRNRPNCPRPSTNVVASAESEAEQKAQREEQRRQLLQIQEELKRAREAKERKHMEAEREERRKQLLQIQEELKREREKRSLEKQMFEAREVQRRIEEIARIEEIQKDAEEQKKRAECVEKTKAFLKEYCGVEFGDSIQKFLKDGESAEGKQVGTFKIPMQKKYWYFEMAEGRFLEGRLYSVVLTATFSNKYSQASCDAQFDKASKKLWDSLGVPENGLCDWGAIEYARSGSRKWTLGNLFGNAFKKTKDVEGYCYCGMRDSNNRTYRMEFLCRQNFEEYWASYAEKKEEAENKLKAKKEEAENKLKAEKESKRRAEQDKKRAEGETLPDPE